MSSAPRTAVTAQAGLRARNLRTVAALAALFLVPLALAFFTYYATGWRPIRHVNHGTLISPPRPLAAVGLPRVSLAATPAPAAAQQSAPGERGASPVFRKQWSLVYIGDGACDAGCRWALFVLRQTRLGLGDDMTRVARVFLVSAGCCDRGFLARAYPGLVVLDATGPRGAALLAQFPGAGIPDVRARTLYIVDPLGNLMMSYDARANPHGLLQDLQKLLRLSHIG
ncbi:MAG: hypothetical protein WA747_14675 [Steroidobacteraceae bacterium]